jgi:hypothetical protein
LNFNKSKNSDQAQTDHLVKLAKNVVFGISQPAVEIVYGIRKDTIPYLPILAWGLIFDFLILSHLDQRIFKLAKLGWLYPQNPISYSIYSFIGATLGFWIWGAIQTRKKTNMIERLTEVFQETGLKSPMGKLPNFIFDKPVDELVRRLRVTNAFMPKGKFIEAKASLESSLQVYIDEISESKSGGTVDLLYSHFEISKMVEMKEIKSIGRHRFLIGQTRAKTIYSTLLETPHLLIGGQTGGGKSTFLRQVITTLYCNNPDYNFTLIDMKGGLEFQLFDNRERIKVISTPNDSSNQFTVLDQLLSERFELLKANQCKDIEEFQKKPKDQLKLPAGVKSETFKLNRNIVVIDEAAELFLAGGKMHVSQVQEMTRKVIRLAAQGRAVGIHLIVATQKPDSKAISSQIKANLTGIISFPMATLGASFSILGNGRAKELPSIPGRAVWKSGLDQFEVQTAFLNPDQTKEELDKCSPQKDQQIEEATV